MTKLDVKPLFLAALVSIALSHPALFAQEPKKPAPFPPDKVLRLDPKVKEVAERQEQVPILIVLKAQPQHRIARAIKSRHQKGIEEQAERIRRILRQYRPETPFERKHEEIEYARVLDAQLPDTVRQEVEDLNRGLEKLLQAMRKEIAAATENAVADSQKRIDKLVEDLGGEITGHIGVINAVSAVVPAHAIEALAAEQSIAEIRYDHPGEPELNVQASSLGVASWWGAGYDGGIWDVGVLDTGVEETHSALSSHTFIENYTPNDYHGTGVACMYASTHSTYRGLAYGLDKILVDNAGSTSTSMAGADWMIRLASDDPEVINYSYGNGMANSNDWDLFARFVDAVVFDYNTSWAKSAGNKNYGTTTITIPANNYNALTVANMNDQNTVTRGDDVIRYSSSRGPTVYGRKKPDITAPGHNTYTCDVGNSWQNLGGTSSAAPKVGAGTLLLQDAGVWDPKTIKAILINTADSWEDNGTQTTTDDGQVPGKEWNKTYGWGYLDLWHAYFHRNDYFRSSVKPNGQPGDYKLYKGYAFSGDKATLVWERDVDYKNAATPTTYRDLSDIDLRMYRETDNGYVDSDVSIRDNVHQVAATSSEPVVVKVYAYSSSFDGASLEPFALATEEGFSAAAGPAFAVNLSAPAVVSPGTTFTVTASVANTGDVDAHYVSVTLSLPPGFTLVSGPAYKPLGSVTDGTSDTASWKVRAPSTWVFGAMLTAQVNSYSYGETFAGNGTRRVTVFKPFIFPRKFKTLTP